MLVVIRDLLTVNVSKFPLMLLPKNNFNKKVLMREKRLRRPPRWGTLLSWNLTWTGGVTLPRSRGGGTPFPDGGYPILLMGDIPWDGYLPPGPGKGAPPPGPGKWVAPPRQLDGVPPSNVNRQTPVKTVPYLILRMRAVTKAHHLRLGFDSLPSSWAGVTAWNDA